MKPKLKGITFVAGIAVCMAGLTAIADNISIYGNDGKINFQGESEKIALENDKKSLTVYDETGNKLYTANTSDIDSITYVPVADILDVEFKADGTAEDISAMKNPVETNKSGALNTYFSNTYKRYVAKFSNTWAGSTSGYYKINYSNNQKFKDAIADGHTLEAVVMADYTEPIKDGEAKFFSSHEAGGTGLYVCKAFRGKNGKNELCFLPHVGGGWKFASSGIVPVPKTYYHVVGVWDKEAGKARVYINGKLENEIDAKGEFKFPKDNSLWFSIGSDAGPTAQLGWSGDVVLARIYDKPLSGSEVGALWHQIDVLQQNAQPDMVTDVTYTSALPVKVGKEFNIEGTGFQNGDKIKFTAIADDNRTITFDGKLTEKGLAVTVTKELVTGEYRITLIRDDKTQDLGTAKMVILEQFPKAPGVVAHRGYWDIAGAAQNSVAALKEAQELGTYGSEADVWLTTDGYLVMNHDQKINGIEIQDNPYSKVKDIKLSNGETLPQLKDFLEALKDKSKTTKLFLEVKTHNSSEKNMAVVKAVIDAIKEAGVRDRVQFIAFDLNVCKEIVRLDPEAEVGYLNGGLTPKQLYDAGIKGIHYSQKQYRNNPTWMKEANDLGMTVNVQGCNTVSDMAEMINMGADLISTDKPTIGMEVRQYYIENQ